MAELPDSILEVPGNKSAIDALVRLLRSDRHPNRVVPVIGSGFSVLAGYPDRREVLGANPSMGDEELGVHSSAIAARMGTFPWQDFLSEKFQDRPVNAVAKTLGRAIHELSHGPVLTDVFDHSIDQAFGSGYGRLTLPEYRHRAPLDFTNARIIVKLSGDVQLPNTITFDISLDYEHRSFLSAVIGTTPLLFVDFTGGMYADVLVRTIHTGHWAILVQACENRWPDRGVLDKWSIRPIIVPRLDDIALLISYLADSISPGQAPAAPPTVPEVLVGALADQSAIALIGSGFGARARFPTWSQLVSGLLVHFQRVGLVDRTFVEHNQAALDNHEIGIVADNVISMTGEKTELIVEYVRSAFDLARELPKSHLLLRRLPLDGVMTSNFDTLLDDAFQKVLTPSDPDCVARLEASKGPFLLKLWGTPARPETLMLSPIQYQEMLARNPPFAQWMESIFFSRTILFLGCSLDGIMDYLQGFTFRGGVPVQHYALVATNGVAWKAKAEQLKRRFNITVIDYPDSNGHVEVDLWLEALVNAVEERRKSAAPHIETPSCIRAIEMENIGVFERLRVEFPESSDPRSDRIEQWKVLLGDNGVGKSTILRAIALAMVGGDGRAYALKLIRKGQSFARITLKTDRNPDGYVTEIFRSGQEAHVVSKPTRALEIEGSLVIGVPAVRLISWNPVPGPQSETRVRPAPEDVMALLQGEIDPHTDNIKQWIVNQWTKFERNQDANAKRALDRFFEIVSRLMGDQQLRLDRVTDRYEVLIQSSGPPVELAALSLGMMSLVSWLAVLVQRLFEFHADKPDPTAEHAIVLLDEIDAHMHPKWQQRVAAILKEEFPKVQFITTTHSPIIISGMPHQQVTRLFRNDDGIVEAMELDEDSTAGRSDQILTRPGFDLRTTLPYGVQKDMEEYERRLSDESDRGPEFWTLHNRIEKWIGPSAHTELARESRTLALSVLDDKTNGDGRRQSARKVLDLIGDHENL